MPIYQYDFLPLRLLLLSPIAMGIILTIVIIIVAAQINTCAVLVLLSSPL